jgi:hypothetical protein
MDSVRVVDEPSVSAIAVYWTVIGSLSLAIVLKLLMILAMVTSEQKPRLDRSLATNHGALVGLVSGDLWLQVEVGPTDWMLVPRAFGSLWLAGSVAWVAYEWSRERFGTANPVQVWRCRTKGECPVEQDQNKNDILSQ